MYVDWVEIVNPNEVSKITHMVNVDSSPDSLKEYLMSRFHKILHNRAVGIDTFDNEATLLLIEFIKQKHMDQGLIYMVLKMYVYHTYMVAYHQMNNDEYRLLRYKIKKITDPLAVY